ncbi:SsrA-binding protein SmpB [Rubrivirga sp. IMCC45206]|uniref:SsrA-binding protein SmpB n=1 Tax=Rubrivirga sp. IMCC45206 TaxID=3391614 RepID=UPI00399013C0
MAEGRKTIATNRRAGFDYEILDRFEAGIVLTGSEVKSLRQGSAQIAESFVKLTRQGADIVNLTIPPYEMGGHFNHEPRQTRRLLLHKAEIDKLRKGTEQKGMTIIPTKIYFKGGRAKVEIALGKGKKTVDKRNTIAERESKRRLDRVMKER